MSIGSIPNKFEWTTNVIKQLTIDKVTRLISRLKKVIKIPNLFYLLGIFNKKLQYINTFL